MEEKSKFEFWALLTLSIQCDRMTYHEVSKVIDLEIDISKQIHDIAKNYQIISNNINSLTNVSDDKLVTISALLGIELTIDEIKVYINDHRYFSLEEGSKISVSIKMSKEDISNVF